MRQSTHHIHRHRSANHHNNALRRSTGKGSPFFSATVEQSFFRPDALIQPKLTVNAPDDIYEKEADAVADKVMQMPDPQIQRQEEEEEEMFQMKEYGPAIQRKCDACEAEESLKRQPMQEEEEEVMLKPQSSTVQRKCATCEKEEEQDLQRKPLAGAITPFVQRREADGGEVNEHVTTSLQSTKGGGQPLPEGTQSWMESRFGTDFSRVKVHTDSNAVQLSRELNAQAFTHGSDIYFNQDKFAPGTHEGKRLLAHELTHTIQQSHCGSMLQRISFDSCTTAQETTVSDAHSRAIEMLDNAIVKLGTYNGTTPADVKTSLTTHFHGSSSALAGWIRFNLQYLRLFVDLPQYECHSVQSIPNPAWTMWCVPFTDIELYPNWFSSSRDYRAALLIHEWVHHYGCNFDLGYKSDPGYSGHGTTRSLLNADPWQWLVYDIR